MRIAYHPLWNTFLSALSSILGSLVVSTLGNSLVPFRLPRRYVEAHFEVVRYCVGSVSIRRAVGHLLQMTRHRKPRIGHS